MIFKDSRVYNFLKWLALVALDAIGVAYEALAEIWNLPYGEQVFKTCTVVSVLLGALIGVSSIRYQKMLEDQEEK